MNNQVLSNYSQYGDTRRLQEIQEMREKEDHNKAYQQGIERGRIAGRHDALIEVEEKLRVLTLEELLTNPDSDIRRIAKMMAGLIAQSK